MGGEEVLQLEESLGSGQVFSIGYARDGRFVQINLFGNIR